MARMRVEFTVSTTTSPTVTELTRKVLAGDSAGRFDLAVGMRSGASVRGPPLPPGPS